MRLPSLRNAVLLHFGASLAIFLILVYLMMRIWYPGALFTMDGGVQGLSILAPIDLVLGPLLTLLFYRPTKKSVKLDMCCIALVQVLALSYGIYSVYQQRPVALVFAQERFETLSHAAYVEATDELTALEVKPQSLEPFGDRAPRLIYARSHTPESYGQYLADLLNGLPELRERSDRYLPLVDGRAEIEPFAIDTATAAPGTEMVEVPAVGGRNQENVVAEHRYPLKGRYGMAHLVLNQKTFELIRIEAIEQP
jgi:hypothetical protein